MLFFLLVHIEQRSLLLIMAKQLLLAHEPQHALMVDRIAAILKFCCDPPVSVIRKLQSYLLNLVNQIRRFAIFRSELFP